MGRAGIWALYHLIQEARPPTIIKWSLITYPSMAQRGLASNWTRATNTPLCKAKNHCSRESKEGPLLEWNFALIYRVGETMWPDVSFSEL